MADLQKMSFSKALRVRVHSVVVGIGTWTRPMFGCPDWLLLEFFVFELLCCCWFCVFLRWLDCCLVGVGDGAGGGGGGGSFGGNTNEVSSIPGGTLWM